MEMASLAAACDAVYLVVPQERFDAEDVQGLLEAIPRLGVRCAGVC